MRTLLNTKKLFVSLQLEKNMPLKGDETMKIINY